MFLIRKQIRKLVWLNALGAFIFIALLGATGYLGVKIARGSTNISSGTTEHWAWNDIVGWMDFYNTGTITVSSQKLTGYASSSAGDISLDCATTRSGDICGVSNYSVTNDGLGNLSGWGWNDTYGWISFDCNNDGGCATSTYRVFVDPNNGYFCGSSGSATCYAWNDVVGWTSFNCANDSSCGTSNYKVVTSWVATSTTGYVDSTTFDTGSAQGAQLNSVLWQGDQPSGTSVRFQFAVSNSSSGPWTYVGGDGTENTYYSVAVNTSQALDYSFFNDFRYFRYRTTLVSNQAQTETPRVDDVIVNWSP